MVSSLGLRTMSWLTPCALFLTFPSAGEAMWALQEPEELEHPVPEVESSEEGAHFRMRLLAARRDNLWMTRKMEGEVRDGPYYVAGWASEETLRLLEEIYAGPRIRTDKFELDGSFRRLMGHGCRSPNLFRVQFVDEPERTSILTFAHGRWKVSGESGFQLEVTKEQEVALLAMDAWLSPADGPELGLPERKFDPLPWYEDLQRSGWLESPLSHERGDSPVGLHKAECLRTRMRSDLAHSSDPRVEIESIGMATASTRKSLQGILHGHRRSTIRLWPDGRTEDPTVDATADDWVECTMEDGQVLWLEHYPDLGFWVVRGEGAFRLDVEPPQSKEMLLGSCWEME